METEAPREPTSKGPYWLRYVFGRNPAWTLVRILFVTFVVLVLFKFVLLPIRVTGDSMFPNYRNGQIKFANKLAYLKHPPKRGDVVAVEFAGREVLLLKRIVGLPGETVQVKSGDVYINGKRLEEPYANGKIPAPDRNRLGRSDPIPLGPSEYMVVGDNRPISEGYIKQEREIIGKVF
jgi:signal peptidase I